MTNKLLFIFLLSSFFCNAQNSDFYNFQSKRVSIDLLDGLESQTQPYFVDIGNKIMIDKNFEYILIKSHIIGSPDRKLYVYHFNDEKPNITDKNILLSVSEIPKSHRGVDENFRLDTILIMLDPNNNKGLVYVKNIESFITCRIVYWFEN